MRRRLLPKGMREKAVHNSPGPVDSASARTGSIVVMTTIIRSAAASEFLALVPQLVQCHPARSIVLVPFHRGASLGAMRIDLPDPEPDDPAEIERVASTLIGMICRIPEADAVTLVVYVDLPFAAADGIVHAPLIAELLSRADSCGLSVPDALCVAADGWGSYLDPEVPPRGRPLTEIASLPGEVDRDQSAGASLPRVARPQRAAATAALRELDKAIRVFTRTRRRGARDEDVDRLSPLAIAALDALDDLPALLEDVLDRDPDELEPFDVAAMIWCMERPALRDVALSQWASGQEAGDAALAAQLLWQAGAEYPEEFARFMWGEGPRPDPARLQRGLQLVRRVGAMAPKSRSAGPIAAAGWISWALGRSTHAAWYAERALRSEPEHGLAEIVASMTAAGHLPDWAFTRRTAPAGAARAR
jgi:hypothetical protein